MTALCTYSIHLSTSDLLSFVISNTDKHEFSRTWKWITYCNDVMNDVLPTELDIFDIQQHYVPILFIF